MMPTNEAAEARTAALLKSLGRQIAAERKRRGLTQDDLAGLTGYAVSKRQVGKIERGTAGQVQETFLLAAALDVKVSDLVRAAERFTA
jgi:transcriptional regulator with XRE-family HTH domain